MEYKQLFFKVDIALVEDSLAKLVLPERIDLFGTGPKEGQTGVSKIEARIINSKMEPGDNTQLKELCRSFAIRVRNLLQEPNSFDEYYISFDREVTKGTATTRDYRQVKFLVKDL